jgi:Amt family ammonium transporter
VLPLVVLLSASGSIFIGLICGVAVVFSIEFIDKKLKLTILLDLLYTRCGALGTLLVGVLLLMADYFTVVDLKTRSSGYWVFSIATWAMGASFIVLFILKKTMGLQ